MEAAVALVGRMDVETEGGGINREDGININTAVYKIDNYWSSRRGAVVSESD